MLNAVAARFKNVEVFVSAIVPTTANAKFSGGTSLGVYQGLAMPAEVVQFTSSEGVMGRYVVIQCDNNNHMNVAGIFVYSDYSHEKTKFIDYDYFLVTKNFPF